LPNDSLIGLVGLVVAICSIVLTVALRFYDYRKQGSQRRIDRIGNALRKLSPKLLDAKVRHEMRPEDELMSEQLVIGFHSAVEQICKMFREEIMSKGLYVDMKKESPAIFDKLTELCVRQNNMDSTYLRKSCTEPKNKNLYYDELRRNVFKDTEIKRLIEELVPMVDEWLAKHP